MDASKIGLKYPTYNTGMQKQPTPAQGQNFAALIASAMGTAEDAAKIAKGATTTKTVMLDSDKGEVSIDSYFAKPEGPIDFDGPNAPPLLMPTARNIDALAAHASAKLKTLMAANGIASAPSEIRYDSQNTMQLPDDYAYADQFKKMLEENPDMDKELRTIDALTSHYTEMQKSLPFIMEYSAARTGAEAKGVVAKYSHLFSNSPRFSQIALSFSPGGGLIPTADGQAYNASM